MSAPTDRAPRRWHVGEMPLPRGWRPNRKRLVITLDGVEQRLVMWADEAKGELEAFVPNADGKPQVDPKDSGRAWSEVRRGVVRIEERP